MATTSESRQRLVESVLARYPKSFSAELRIRRLDRPAPLFQLLVMSLLMSARIRAEAALDGTRALFDAGWTTAPKLASATWSKRTRTLNRAGYARYDERTSTMLGESAEMLVDMYRGDLRKLREEADRDPRRERELLQGFKGIGDVGVDIFFRDVQREWTEVHPFLDRRASAAAKRLRLPSSAAALARLVPSTQFVPLVNALVRVDLDGSHDDVRAAARRDDR